VLRSILPLKGKPAPDALVFQHVAGGPLTGFSALKRRLDAATKVSRWRLHDFRRTGVTALARMGFPPHVADKLLNHVQGTISGVAAVYQRHDFAAERKAALEAWAAHVLRCAEGGG
jgi:integrase